MFWDLKKSLQIHKWFEMIITTNFFYPFIETLLCYGTHKVSRKGCVMNTTQVILKVLLCFRNLKVQLKVHECFEINIPP